MAGNYIMTTSVSDCDNPYSLVCGHAYTLLGAYAIKNSAGVVTNRLI